MFRMNQHLPHYVECSKNAYARAFAPLSSIMFVAFLGYCDFLLPVKAFLSSMITLEVEPRELFKLAAYLEFQVPDAQQ